jgi:hypothetical protein
MASNTTEKKGFTMKKMLIMSSLVFASALHSIAAEAGIGKTSGATTTKVASKGAEKATGKVAVATKTGTAKKSLSAVERANHLTDEMIQDLKLSNYQARELRKINQEKVNRMMAIEAAGGDASNVDNECKGVCKDRDKELENLLSTEQYMQYFSKRPIYYKMDKDYAAGGFLNPKANAIAQADVDDDDEEENTSGTSGQIASK